MFNNIPKDVLVRMSPAEVASLIEDLRKEASRLEDWNDARQGWREPAPAWQVSPLPCSGNDYGKVLVDGKWRWAYDVPGYSR